MYSHGAWPICLPCDRLWPFSRRLGKASEQTQVVRSRPAVRDNRGQHQLCLAKLAVLFASNFASWCSYFLSRMSFCPYFPLFTVAAKKGAKAPASPKKGKGGTQPRVPLNSAITFGDQMQRPGKLIKTPQVFNSLQEQIDSSQRELF